VSLIDEALKRAQAAADRDAPRDRPWVPTPLPDAGLARRRRAFRAGLVGLAAGVGLAAIAALLFWAARGSAPRADRPAAAAPAIESPARAAVPVPTEARPTGGGGDGTPPSRAARGAAAAIATPAAAHAPTRAATRMLVPSIETTPVHVGPPPRAGEAQASASGSPRVHAQGAAAGKSYRGKVDLPDGGSLELGGIVWSEADPRALVNDRVVGVGAYVQGYTIERIEEDRVVLEKDGKRITVTVK